MFIFSLHRLRFVVSIAGSPFNVASVRLRRELGSKVRNAKSPQQYTIVNQALRSSGKAGRCGAHVRISTLCLVLLKFDVLL